MGENLHRIVWFAKNGDESMENGKMTNKSIAEADQQAIEVFFVISGNYAKFIPVATLSILENTKSMVNFHVIHIGLDPVDELKITDFIHRFDHASVEFLDATDEMTRFDGVNIGWYATPIAFARFLVPHFSQKHKAIYLDVDVLIRYDLQKLWDIDLGTYAMAAARNIKLPEDHEGFFKTIETSLDHVYFNAGLFIADCNKWRQERIVDEIIRIARERKTMIKLPTQDPMNLYFESNYLQLEDSCNISPKELFYTGRLDLKGRGIHYYGVGFNKPWHDSTAFGAEVFWEVARKTPYYEVFLQEMTKRIVRPVKRQADDLTTANLKLQQEIAGLRKLAKEMSRRNFSWYWRSLFEVLFYEKRLNEKGVKRRFKLFGIGVYSKRKEGSKRVVRILGFKITYHRPSDAKAPRTLNEKIEWIKYNYRIPLLTQCTDKYAVRDYVKSKVPEDILIPLLGVYQHSGEISYDQLPERFILKATHGSGWNILCHDKSAFDRERANHDLDAWLQQNYYNASGEWSYKDVPPRIICEQFIAGEDGNPPTDYKFFCFHGKPKYIEVISNRFSDKSIDFYDCDWKHLPLATLNLPNSPALHRRPDCLQKMLKIAEILAQPFPFVRVDLYNIGNQVYFGELTFYPYNARQNFNPDEFDMIFGRYLNLKKIKIFK